MVLLAGPALAAEAESPKLTLGGYDLGGAVTAGYRLVDVDGSANKFLQDYNLHTGLRLFDLDVGATATNPDEAPLDRFHLVVDTPGNEPVSTYLLTASDTKNWDLRANFVQSKYFYDMPQLFQNPVPGDSRLDDLHGFDQTRTNGSVDVIVRRPNLPTFFAGYRLYQLEGDNTSTIFQSPSETFVVRAPEATRASVARVGTEFQALGTDVFLQQEYRWVTRDVGGHGPVPGGAAGVDPTDGAVLNNYQSSGHEEIDAPTTTVRIRRPFGDRAEVTGAYLYSHASLDAAWNTVRNATSDSPSVPVASRVASSSNASLDTQVVDLAGSVLLTPQARFHLAYRFDERAQSGGIDQSGTGGLLVAGTGYHVRLNRVTGDVEYEPRRDLSLRAGLRFAWRDANLSGGPGPVSTTVLGVIADARYHPAPMVDAFLRYETAQVDDPYFIAGDPTSRPPLPGREITLTFTNRGSAGLTFRPRPWASLTYRFIADSRENSSFAAHSEAFGNSLAVTLTPLPNLTALVSYARRDLDNRADILFAPRYAQATSLQSGTENVLVSQLTYAFGLAGQRWESGWNVYYIQTSQAVGVPGHEQIAGRSRLDLDRIDAGAFLTWRHAWIEPSIEVRRIDYTESGFEANDYRATIVSFKLTKRFGAAPTP
ncbi:MAG TPA: hypothetical protein VMS22_07010 [Candidatus Eisenbacteria bacterium]|nr:hypothetical protein [Candidatus Eisenbacteria bacterium]